MYKNILLLSAGRRVELLQGFENAVGELLPQYKVFCADGNPGLSSACQFAAESFKVPFASSADYISELITLCVERKIGMVIPTIDSELEILANHCHDFSKRGITIVVSDLDLIKNCRDKRKTSSLFQRHSIATPKIFNSDAISFPCFTKPFDGSCGVGAQRLESASDLSSDMRCQRNRIYMELVPDGHREMSIDLYFDRFSNLKAAVPRVRLEVRAGEVSKGITCRDWVYNYLLQRIRRIEGARGCLTLQLFAGSIEGEVNAIEINPRFGGGFPLTLAAGGDYPKWLIQEYLLGEEIAFFDCWENDLLMLRYDSKALVHNYV